MGNYSFKFLEWWDSHGSFMQNEDLETVAQTAYKQSLQDALDLYDFLDPSDRDLEQVVRKLLQET